MARARRGSAANGARPRAFERTAGYFWIFDYLVRGDGSASLEGLAVSPEYFEVIGRTPVLGRAFTRAETSAQTHPVVLISDDLWQRQFQSDPRVVGTTVTLSRHRTLTIVGVMPPGIRFLPAPLSEDAPGYDVERQGRLLGAAGARGVSARRADLERGGAAPARRERSSRRGAEVAAIASRQAAATPALREHDGDGRAAPGGAESASRNGCSCRCWARRSASCSSPAPMPVRCSSRGPCAATRELAVHAALGASPARLVRRAFAEHVAVGVIGGALGSVLAYVTLSVLVRTTAASIPRLDAVALDGRLLAWSIGLGILTGLLAGLPSAVRIHRGWGRPGLDPGGPSARVVGGGWRTLQVADRRADRPHLGLARPGRPARAFPAERRRGHSRLSAPTTCSP